MILGALQAKGGQKYLERCADENPTAFLTLVGKVLPLQLAGAAEAPVVIKIFKYDGPVDDAHVARPPIIDADPAPLSLPQPASSPTLPTSAKETDLGTPVGRILPLSPRRERCRI